MKPASFLYHAPRTLDDAIVKLRDLEDAKVLVHPKARVRRDDARLWIDRQ